MIVGHAGFTDTKPYCINTSSITCPQSDRFGGLINMENRYSAILIKTTAMAEIQTINSSQKRGVHRIIKKSTRVDLTPMVDLGFLLITFFVFTSELSKPKVMDIVSPVDNEKTMPVCASCVLTVLLQKNNVIKYYEGIANASTALKETNFSPEGIRTIILQKIKSMVHVKDKTADDFVLIIKPTDESSFSSFVNMMDEVAINIVKHYYIGEVDNVDEMLLTK